LVYVNGKYISDVYDVKRKITFSNEVVAGGRTGIQGSLY
jgi:hypothetical protein